jgi:hypothetical protein
MHQVLKKKIKITRQRKSYGLKKRKKEKQSNSPVWETEENRLV